MVIFPLLAEGSAGPEYLTLGEALRELKPYIRQARRHLMKAVQSKDRTRWLHGKREGALDPSGLHRLAAGTSRRVFRQKRKRQGGRAAVMLMLDLSASMRGEALDLCRKLALTLAETLDKLRCPLEIIGFSTVDRDLRYEVARKTGVSEEELSKRYHRLVPLKHTIAKEFGEPWRSAAGKIGGLRSECLTPMGESLQFSAKRLMRRPEQRRVLLCLTDGKPVTGAWDESVTMAHAKETARDIEDSDLDLVGIGLCEESVEEIFQRHTVVMELDELADRTFRELADVLT